MLKSGKKNSHFARQKKKYSNNRDVRKKNSERNHHLPLQVKWSVLNMHCV